MKEWITIELTTCSTLLHALQTPSGKQRTKRQSQGGVDGFRSDSCVFNLLVSNPLPYSDKGILLDCENKSVSGRI